MVGKNFLTFILPNMAESSKREINITRVSVLSAHVVELSFFN